MAALWWVVGGIQKLWAHTVSVCFGLGLLRLLGVWSIMSPWKMVHGMVTGVAGVCAVCVV